MTEALYVWVCGGVSEVCRQFRSHFCGFPRGGYVSLLVVGAVVVVVVNHAAAAVGVVVISA